MTTSSGGRQESHRIYWQQWTTSVETTDDNAQPQQQKRQSRSLITSSAAVRISDAAKSADVTALLRRTLDLPKKEDEDDDVNSCEDTLVLVGTLHSLPKNYLQFEHDQPPPQESSGRRDASSPLSAAAAAGGEPLHVVRTLQRDEKPLFIRDSLLQHLKQRQQQTNHQTQRTVIAPRLQWFFVPSSVTISDCIELDGYCTDMEPDWDADENDDVESSDDEDDMGDAIEMNSPILYPWRARTELSSEEAAREQHHDEPTDKVQRILRRERRQYQLLSSSQSVLQRHCVSGYLTKRSRKDPHVWKRVFCVLTDDHLWCISRLYSLGDSQQEQHRVAKHQRINLNRALLLESSSEHTPLQRIPFSFEVISSEGTSHVFRAPNRRLQLRWIQCLGERIVQTHENSGLEHAELIVEDEALARNRRLLHCAAEPLVERYAECADEASETAVRAVMQWGLDVADYRERCRHIQDRMPNRKHVAVSEGMNPAAPTPRKLFDSSESPNGVNGDQYNLSQSGGLDANTRAMIRASWDAAALILAKAAQLAMDQSQLDNNNQRSLGRNVENLCRHVDCVITGRFHSLTETSDEPIQKIERNHDSDMPPIDLFDPLLEELQSNSSVTQTPQNGIGKKSNN